MSHSGGDLIHKETTVVSFLRYDNILERVSRKNAAVLLNFVQMRGGLEGPAQFFVTFS